MIKYFKKFPLLLLLFGPPVLRLDVRAADASLRTNIDIWILIQIGLFLSLGLLSLHKIISNWTTYKKFLFIKRVKNFITILLLFIIFLFGSCFLSPNFKITFAFSFLFFITLISGIQFTFEFISTNEVTTVDMLKTIRFVCIFLLAIVTIMLLTYPNFVSSSQQYYGLRVLGGRVANVPLISFIILVITCYGFIFYDSFDPKPKSIFYLFISLLFIYLAKTRAFYFTSIFFLIWIGYYAVYKQHKISNVLVVSLMFWFFAIFGVYMLFNSNQFFSFIVRGDISEQDINSLSSGRLVIFNWVTTRIQSSPLGIGYIAGFKKEFLNLGYLNGLPTFRIGNAHNSFFEILIGTGWGGLFFYCLLLSSVLILAIKTLAQKTINSYLYDSDIRFLLFLFLTLIITSLVSSDFVIPTYSSFGIFWNILFLLFALTLKKHKSH